MRWYLTNPEREFSEWSPLAIGASIPNVSLPTLEPQGALHGPSWNILPLTDNPPTVAADRYISARYIRADTESALAIYQTRAKTQEMIDAEYLAAHPLDPLTPRRFWLAALSLGVTEDMVDAEIAKLPEPVRSAAKIEKNYATTYERTHSLVKLLPAKFNVTDAALDNAWRNAPA